MCHDDDDDYDDDDMTVAGHTVSSTAVVKADSRVLLTSDCESVQTAVTRLCVVDSRMRTRHRSQLIYIITYGTVNNKPGQSFSRLS